MSGNEKVRQKLRSPIVWFGGKGLMVKKLLPLIPPHREYVEPFFGGGSLFFAKEPAKVETINDIDGNVMHFFRILRDHPDEFIHLAELTPYSRELYNECRETWRDEEDPIRRAWKWWVVARMSFGGMFGSSWGSAVTASFRGMAGTVSNFLTAVDSLPAVAARLKRAQIENDDALNVMRRYCTPTSFCYCDPPYVKSTRRSGGYAYEMSDEAHREFIETILSLPGMFMISGYPNEIYEELEKAGWERREFKTACYAAAKTRATQILGAGSSLKKQSRTEVVWLSPNCAKEDVGLWSR